jgi:tetratricopeptide (TPR) repeat protein
MKYLLLILFAGFTLNLSAQMPRSQAALHTPFQTTYGLLQFNTPFYDLENRWVVVAKSPQLNKYVFGMVYLDMQTGFSLRAEGTFSVDAQGRVSRDSTDHPKNVMIGRLGPTTTLFCAIPDAMLADLDVKPVPDWLASYHSTNEDRNSVAFKVAYGRHLNSAGAAAKAVTYLEEAYKTEPHAAGVEFELSYAYNVLKQYDKAIEVLNAAIKNAPDNQVFYSELAFSYTQQKDYTNAIKTYNAGLPLAKRDMTIRTTMVTNLTLIYDELQQFDKAQAVINDLITDSPYNITAYVLSATTFSKANDFDNAIKSYSKAIDITGVQNMETKAELAINVAMIYRDKKNDHDQFVAWGQKARSWAPANGRAAASLKTMGF